MLGIVLFGLTPTYFPDILTDFMRTIIGYLFLYTILRVSETGVEPAITWV